MNYSQYVAVSEYEKGYEKGVYEGKIKAVKNFFTHEKHWQESQKRKKMLISFLKKSKKSRP